MDRDTLRQALLAGIDQMLGNWLFMRQCTSQQKALLHAQRELYASNDQVVDALLAILNPKGGS